MSKFNQNRSVVMQILVLLVGAILIVRLFMLQVVGAGGYKDASENQAVKKKIILPARGLLIDRNEKIILNNNMFYNVQMHPRSMAKQKDFDTTRLCQLLNVTRKDFDTLVHQKIMLNGRDRKIPLYYNQTPEAIARLQEELNNFRGIELVEKSQRTYPFGVGAPFMGYINEVTREMLKKERYASYRRGNMVGITGIEKSYEDVLRGVPGVQYVLQDVRQREVGSYKDGADDELAIAGKDLRLHLDVKLQKLAEEMMANKLGSAIAIEPKTGGILAFVSSPTYDPNLLTGKDKSDNFKKIMRDATGKTYNRGIQASYMPGSTFKPITALVGLDMGVISANSGYPCSGGYYACGRKIGCTHYGGGHAANLSRAIANSCNAYFCNTFRLSVDSPGNKNVREGIQRWGKYMDDFGLGRPIGIDLPRERGGNIPTLPYFDRVYDKQWNSCNMSILGMGQGELLLSPLQMANSMCIIANRGYYKIPHFVKSIGNDSAHKKLEPYLKKNVVAKISNQNFEAVIDGMQGVIEYGTARRAKIRGIAVCGKTGTVENHTRINGKRIKRKNHSVFVAFAPRDNPKIAVAVIVENSGYGSQWAGPIASLMMEQFITDTIAPSRRGIVNRMKRAKLIPRLTYVLDSLKKKKLREDYQEQKRLRDSVKRRENYLDSVNGNSQARVSYKKLWWYQRWAMIESKKKINEHYKS